MIDRKKVCSQQTNCMSCPLSRKLTDKDCRELTNEEIEKIMDLFREFEKHPTKAIIKSIEYYQAKAEKTESEKEKMKQLLRDCMRILAVAEFDFPKFRDEADKIYEQIEKIIK